MKTEVKDTIQTVRNSADLLKYLVMTVIAVAVLWAGVQTSLQERPTREEMEPRLRALEAQMIETVTRLKTIDEKLDDIKAALR